MNVKYWKDSKTGPFEHRIKTWYHSRASQDHVTNLALVGIWPGSNALISGHPGELTPGNPRAFAPRHLQIPTTRGQYSSTKSYHCPSPGEHSLKGLPNKPRSIYQYSNMAPRLSGQTSIFGVVFFVSKSLLGIEGQRKLEKFAILTRKPRSHARILIYRTWPIVTQFLVQLLIKA